MESELTLSEHDTIEDPAAPEKGDMLPGGYTVVKRLGQGGCSVALLVEKEGQDFVLKVANDPSQNQRWLTKQKCSAKMKCDTTVLSISSQL